MKKIILFLILLLIISGNETYSQSGLELGKRYLKLGNTYREAGNFNLAFDFLDKGFRIVTSSNDFYWQGVANEFFGYYYRDLAKKTGNKDLLRTAQNYFEMAFNSFDKVVKQRDGSPMAVNSLKNSIREQMRTGFNFNEDNISDNFENNPPKQETTDKNKASITSKDSDCPEITKFIVYQSLREANAEPENVEILDLTGQELTDFPKDILRYTNLKELVLTNLGLTDLPEALGNLQYLQRINLDGNDLTRLPVSLKNLKCLKTIFIRGNFIDCDYLLSLQRNLKDLQIVTDREEENITTIRGR
ncbi:MAG: hypothetical protein N2319_01990 [Candidatus Kapabacteria bacterium]|nr:hypothetical protein [Candidatus Kapabacteria bacterium]